MFVIYLTRNTSTLPEVFGPYASFKEAQDVVNSYLFNFVFIEKQDECVTLTDCTIGIVELEHLVQSIDTGVAR